MKLMRFPVNAAWAFVFGDDMRTARPIRMGSAPLFFERRRDAVWEAESCGLTVDGFGVVSVMKEEA